MTYPRKTVHFESEESGNCGEDFRVSSDTVLTIGSRSTANLIPMIFNILGDTPLRP